MKSACPNQKHYHLWRIKSQARCSSVMVCTAPGCRGVWRTRSSYRFRLPWLRSA